MIKNLIKNQKNFNFSKFYFSSKVNYNIVKQLRDITGAPLMNCKKALEKFNYDLNEAKLFLREKNLIMAEKKLNRDTKCGVFGSKIDEKSFLLLEINSETDFVSKNDEFLNFTDNMLNIIKNNLDNNNNDNLRIEENLDNFLENINNEENNNNLKIEQKLITAKTQENIKISKIIYEKLDNKKLGIYTHKEYKDNIGLNKSIIYCDVNYEINKTNNKKLEKILENLAIHCFSLKPEYIDLNEYKELDDIKKEFINTLPENLKNKPQNVIDNIIEGKLKKIYQDKVMMEQNLGFEESELTIRNYLEKINKNDKISIKIKGYEILNIN